jgi:phosphatidate cytidylyltransferase
MGPEGAEEQLEEPERLFAQTGRPSVPALEEEEGEGGVEAFLFEGEEEETEDVGEAIATERLSHAPSAYAGLPGSEEEEVAELLEGEVAADAGEPAPSPEDLEAAAEHFAESVRDEVRVEPGPEPSTVAPSYDTEPVESIVDLLGPEGTEEGIPSELEEGTPVRTVRVGPDGLGGPSWQEPTTVEVGPDQERRGPGRNMQMAVLTGVVLAAIALGAIAIGTGVFAIFAGIVVLVAQGELYFALQKRHYQPATALGLVAGALVLGAGYYRGESAMLAVTALSVFATFLWFMTVPAQHRRNVVSNIGLTVLGIVWIPLFAGYALAMLKLPDGRGVVLATLGLTIAYDASAFAVGYFWGSRPLSPTVSPKKSWEGAIGATLVVIAVAIGGVAAWVPLLDTIGRSVGLAVVVAVFAPLGDLAESLVKRDLQIKDMGSVLPGHGGILDRIDSMLFVVPAAFLFLRLILV